MFSPREDHALGRGQLAVAVEEDSRAYKVIELGWSEARNSEWYEVRCIETGEAVYETDVDWQADLMCDRYNREGPP